MKKIMFNLCIFVLILSLFLPYNSITQAETISRNVKWSVTLHCHRSEGVYDFIVFGEAPDANDGPPADAYDTVKPPAPMPPYIFAWFNDNLPVPYNLLWKDYRRYPDINKIWNLTIQWIPSSGSSPTTVTISWNIEEFDDSEYDFIFLCTEEGTLLTNMLVHNSYIFSCPAYIPQYLKIICEVNNPPAKPQKPSGPISGEPGVEYTYYTITIDPNSHQLYYQWNWGDGTTSDWLGPFESNQSVEAKHAWSKKGNYEIKVKAKDTFDAESPWSDALPITMPISHKDRVGATSTHTSMIMITSFGFNSILNIKGFIRLINLLINLNYLNQDVNRNN